MSLNFFNLVSGALNKAIATVKPVAVVIAVLSCIQVAFASGNQNNDFVVVIDAGHGGHDVGAVDNGAREKDINLGVAKKLNELIKKKLKNVKTVMTREGDTFVSLQERANIANRNKGNLFISIHTNSVDKSNPNRKNVKGSSVYALGVHKDASNLQVAQRENSVIELESDFQQKYSGFDPSKDESYIIFEMAQKKNLGQSLKFANEAQKQLVGHSDRADRGVKQAGFWVLWATSMPAVLVELDFICNPNEAVFLNSEAGQTRMAEALLKALENYIATPSSHLSNARVTDGSSSESPKTGGKVPQTPANSQVSDKNKVPASETLMKGNAGKPSDSKGSKKKKNNKNKKKGSKIADASGQNSSEEKNEDNCDDTPVLVATARKREKKLEHGSSTVAPRRSSSLPGNRKRRSSTSKKISDAQEFETSSIHSTDENAYLARVEKKEQKVEVREEKEEVPVKKQKGKKDNKKGQDKQTSGKKDKAKSKGSYRRITVSSNGDVLTSEPAGGGKMTVRAEPKKHQAISGHKAKVSHLKTVYKIQILVSSDLLKENNPRFCGLKPISSIRENGMYKYTYGESEDRSEMERELLAVKKKIPDAFIISAKK